MPTRADLLNADLIVLLLLLRNPFMVSPLSRPHPAPRSWAAEPAAVVPTRPRALPAGPNGRRPARRPLRRGRSNRVNNVHPGRVAGRRRDRGHVAAATWLRRSVPR